MTKEFLVQKSCLAFLFSLLAFFPSLAFAGPAGGHYTSGVNLLERGSIPPPGFYTKHSLLHYTATTLNDRDGNELKIPTRGGVKKTTPFKVDSTVLVNRLLYVTDKTFLGANYAMHAIIPLSYPKVTSPKGQRQEHGGLGDIALEPLLLAWHTDSLDAAYGVAVYLPTGEWDEDNVANIGKNFYTLMQTLGATWSLDDAKTLKFGGKMRYEVHFRHLSQDVTQGDNLTMELGLSKAILPTVQLGIVGFGQWQVTNDRGHDVTWDKSVRDRVYGIGPEVVWTIPAAKANLVFNYTQEFGAVDRSQGQFFGVTAALAF